MDLGMPGMGGKQGAREIRKINTDVIIVVASGYGGREVPDVQELLREGIIQDAWSKTAALTKIKAVLKRLKTIALPRRAIEELNGNAIVAISL